jgi:uncharacterized membrane protein YdjX (TVP38/TMEM64 family)
MTGNKRKTLLWVLIVCAALAGILLWGWKAGWLALFTDPKALQALVEKAGPLGPGLFFLLQVAQVIFAPIPGNVTTLVGGVLFGFWRSFMISTLAIIAGSTLAFWLARRFGMALVRRFVDEASLTKYTRLLKGRSGLLLGIVFLFPFFPDDLLCFLAGMTPIRLPAFILLVALTRPWGLLISSLIGSGALVMSWWLWLLVGLVTAAALWASVKYGPLLEDRMIAWLKRTFKNKNS